MTRAISLLGADFDLPPAMPADARHHFPKRQIVQTAIDRLKDSTDADALDTVWWEMALLRFSPIPNDERGQYEGLSYEQFAANFGLVEATVGYAVERATETDDIVLRLHYLAFALDRMAPTGRVWVERQRDLLLLWRTYVDDCRAAAGSDAEDNAALFIEHALVAIGVFWARPGVLRTGDAERWAAWLLQLTIDVRAFPPRDTVRGAGFWRHRWVAPYLRQFASLPSTAVDAHSRDQVLGLLDDAVAHYAREPLADTFAHRVAEVRYELRTHWGDGNAHEEMIRNQVATLLRRAALHKDTGSGMLAQHFFREARRVCETHRQYFATGDIDKMMHEERAAIEHAIEAGEFKSVSASVEIPREQIERVRATAEDTVAGLVAEVALSIPSRSSLEAMIKKLATEAPLRSIFPTTVISDNKVVGESTGEAKNLELDVEHCALLSASLAGQAIATTIIVASEKVGLTSDHLMAPLAPLQLDAGALHLIHQACERLVASDFIAACHILVPRIEDALRFHLRMRGLHATEFKRDVGDGTSRTDDEPLGSMLARNLSDGTTVRDYLGEDFAQYIEWTMTSQTGLNLRNTFAHGQARPRHCTPENAGIALGVLYKLANVAGTSAH